MKNANVLVGSRVLYLESTNSMLVRALRFLYAPIAKQPMVGSWNTNNRKVVRNECGKKDSRQAKHHRLTVNHNGMLLSRLFWTIGRVMIPSRKLTVSASLIKNRLGATSAFNVCEKICTPRPDTTYHENCKKCDCPICVVECFRVC